VSDLLAGCGVTRKAHLRRKDGADFQPLCRTVRYAEGDMEYVGIIKSDMSIDSIKPSEYVPVRIGFDKKGHIYDVRKGKHLGVNKEIATSIAPSVAHLYAILPYEVKRIDAEARGKFQPGDAVTMAVSVTPREKTAGNHTVHVEVIGPDKGARPWYAQNVKLMNGKGDLTIPTALNDPKGRWAVSVKDIASGVTAKSHFVLQ